jgi:hypothetical protein
VTYLKYWRDEPRFALHLRIERYVGDPDAVTQYVTDEFMADAMHIEFQLGKIITDMCKEWFKRTGEYLLVVLGPGNSWYLVGAQANKVDGFEIIVRDDPITDRTFFMLRDSTRYVEVYLRQEDIGRLSSAQRRKLVATELSRLWNEAFNEDVEVVWNVPAGSGWYAKYKDETVEGEVVEHKALPWDDPDRDIMKDIEEHKERERDKHYKNLGKDLPHGSQ